jgi:hypothetical protein
MDEEKLLQLEDEATEAMLELLIEDAVDNDSQRALKLLKTLSFTDPDGLPIYIDWDIEIGNIKAKVKEGKI